MADEGTASGWLVGGSSAYKETAVRRPLLSLERPRLQPLSKLGHESSADSQSMADASASFKDVPEIFEVWFLFNLLLPRTDTNHRVDRSSSESR